MTYLLTLGWPWFAAAFAIGAGVGFVSFTRSRPAHFSGGWVIVAGVLALAAAFAASAAQALAGRDAVTLDIALLAGLAYAAGLPAGGFLKSLGSAEKTQRRPRHDLAPIIVAPAPVAEPVAAFAVVETAAEAAPSPAAAAPPSRAKKSSSGVKPETLDAPRNGASDDLSRIKGLGPKSREKLNALGVFHYDQIAAWNLDNARWIGAAIGAPGRVERDKWIQQARALAGAGTDQ
jgi:predicted flap endonuclease-1-like 5' DNA nuclease